MTVRKIAEQLEVQAPSIQRNLKRNGFGKFGIDDKLPKSAIQHLINGQAAPSGSFNGKSNQKVQELENRNPAAGGESKPDNPPVAPPKEKEESKPPAPPAPQPDPPAPKPQNERSEEKPRSADRTTEDIVREAFALSPLPMLGLAASYGVFLFASHFVPGWVAVVEAGGFELVYIGLAAMKGLTDSERRKAKLISFGAVAVSMTYNALAAGLEMQPDLFSDLSRFWFWVIAVTHGAPLAMLSFLVADLILHR